MLTPDGNTATNTAATMYTVREIGTIDLIVPVSENGSYTYTTKTINYLENSEIQNCVVPIQLLIDFLEISASPDFLEAFENLIIDQDIVLKLFSLTSTETVETERSYPIDILLNARKNMVFRRPSMVTDGSGNTTNTCSGSDITEYRDFTYNLDTVDVSSRTTTTTTSTDYQLLLVSANSWFFKAERDASKNTTTTYTYYGEGGGETTFTPSGNDMLEGADAYDVDGIDITSTSTEDLENQLASTVGDTFDLATVTAAIDSKLQDRSDVQEVIDSYTNNNYLFQEYNPEITEIHATSENGKEKKVKKLEQETISSGAMSYEDNTDAFLGLWKNETGKYEEGATFDPEGKKVAYTDLYDEEEETAYVGDLFENADEILFDLLDFSEDTQSFTPVMKYILYRYTETNYGITSFEDLLNKLGWNTQTVGGDYNVYTENPPEEIVIKDLETLKKAFSGYSGSSRLIEYAQTFLDCQEKYKVNAVFAAAVSITETGAGRAGHAINGKNNWFNIKIPNTDIYQTYSSPQEGIEAFFNLIANGSRYFTKQNYTVSAIGKAGYCENADAPGGWIDSTNDFMTQMFNAAGIDLSYYSSSGGGLVGEFLTVIEEYSQQVQSEPYVWTYSNSNTESTFKRAVKRNNKKVNCAQMVCWALTDIGVLETGQRFYIDSSNQIHYIGGSQSALKENAKTIKIGGKTAKELLEKDQLQAGDICFWRSKQHTNVYAGNKTWYDAGHQQENGAGADATFNKFKTFGPIKSNTLNNNWEIQYIIRLNGGSGGEFLDVAKQCHDYLDQNNYYYSSAANISAGRYVSDGESQGSHIPKPYEGEGNYIDCSAYVTWVLYEYGYTDLAGWQMGSGDVGGYIVRHGGKRKSVSEVEPGDVLVKSGHTEIYAGNGKAYNCGSTEHIRESISDCTLSRFTDAYTVAKP